MMTFLQAVPDELFMVAVGTALFLLLGVFIALMTLTYQKKRLEHQEEVSALVEAYQKEILQAQLEMQEDTFRSISQEIHDNVGQVLSLVRLNVSMMAHSRAMDLEQKVSNSKELLDQAIQDLRGLSRRLNSKYVLGQSLTALLGQQMKLLLRTGAVEASFEATGEEGENTFTSEKKLIIFRIAQEALSNVIRHAAASRVTTRLEFRPDRMILSISDDGKGFAAPGPSLNRKISHGTGIHNMRYRAGLVGASLQIVSEPGAGTQVRLELPIT